MSARESRESLGTVLRMRTSAQKKSSCLTLHPWRSIFHLGSLLDVTLLGIPGQNAHPRFIK